MTMITIQAPADDFLSAFGRRAADVFRAWRMRAAHRNDGCVWTGDAIEPRSLMRRADDIRREMEGIASHSPITQRDLWSGANAWMR